MEVIPLAVFGLCVQGLKNIWTTNTVLQEQLLQGRAALFGNLLIPCGHNISGVQLQLSPLKSSWEHTTSSWASRLSSPPTITIQSHLQWKQRARQECETWRDARITQASRLWLLQIISYRKPSCVVKRHDDSSQCSQNKPCWQALRRSVWLYVVNLFCLCVAGDGHMVLRQALFPVPAGEHVQTHGHAEGHRGAGVHSVPGALRGWAAVTNTPAEISGERTGVTTRLMGLLFLQIKMFVYVSQV